ncbi:hypothetical protein QR685DRAFT_571023 [Neurospora intermedia]|uniref:Secreted protein n=1 Tax=Neurospora intermedia TaxID=5142 RepID=A0ABR3DIC4_NEUIN
MWMLLCLRLWVGVMLCPLCAFDDDVRLGSAPGLCIDGLQRSLGHLVNIIHRVCTLGYPEIHSVRIEWADGAGVVGDENLQAPH